MNRLSVLAGRPGRGPGRARALAVTGVLVSSLLSSLPAAATDHPAIGTNYKQSERPTTKRLKVLSRDASVSLPSSDPTVTGGSVLVELTYGTTTLSEAIPLPASGWAHPGSALTFKSTSPKVRLKIKSGLFRLSASPASLTLANAPHNVASVIVVAGSDRYCLGFGSVAAIY